MHDILLRTGDMLKSVPGGTDEEWLKMVKINWLKWNIIRTGVKIKFICLPVKNILKNYFCGMGSNKLKFSKNMWT